MTDIEFTRSVRLERIGRKPLEQSAAATPGECRAVAARLHLVGVRNLSTRVQLHPETNCIIAVTGAVEAGITQVCVVTGDPFDSQVAAQVRARFTTSPALVEDFDIDRIDAEDEWDDFELVEAGAIDIGELAVQYLSLSLDPVSPQA